MELANLLLYSVFFLSAIFLVIFNVLYGLRIHSVNYRMGFDMPRFLKRALEINALIAFLIMFILAIVLVNAIVTIQVSAIL